MWRRYQKGNKFIKLHLVPSRSFHNKPPNSVKAKYCCKGIGVIQKRLETLQNLLNSVDIAHYSRENSVKLFILSCVSRGRIQNKMKQGAIYQVRKLVGRVLHKNKKNFHFCYDFQIKRKIIHFFPLCRLDNEKQSLIKRFSGKASCFLAWL